MWLIFIVALRREKIVIEDIPADIETLALEKRRELIEAVSEVDDKLAEAFLSDEPIPPIELEASTNS